ncbi:MAG: hypothetical protein K0R85_146 [Devosia sp.]|jgi:hypothetical protein|nr:hypothetical protein [Devosia sp.]
MLPTTPAADERDKFTRLSVTLRQLSRKYRTWAQEDYERGLTERARKNTAEADRCLTDARWYQRRASQNT